MTSKSMTLKSKLHYHFTNLFRRSICYPTTEQLATIPTKPRQMVAFVNPSSGRGRAKKHLKAVTPIFEKYNIRIQLAELKGAKVVYKGSTQTFSTFFKTLDLDAIDGIVICGGDGTVHSVVNALMSRSNGDRAIALPIGILPSGTDNGLCKTILECSNLPYSLASAALVIAKGQTRSLDMFKVCKDQQTIYGLHSFAWGLVSDVDIQSNQLKFLGLLKEWLYGAFYVLRSRLYAGEIRFEPQDINCCGRAKFREGQSEQYISLWAMNVPWAGKSWLTAPQAKLNDGLIDLLIFRKGISRKELATIFFRMQNGSHVRCPNLEYYKTSAFTLNPADKFCITTIDGEPSTSSSIRLEVLKESCFVFCYQAITA